MLTSFVARPWIRLALYSAAIIFWWALAAHWVPHHLEASGHGQDLLGISAEKLDSHYRAEWPRIRFEALALVVVMAVVLELYVARGWSVMDHWFTPSPIKDLGIMRILAVGTRLSFCLWPTNHIAREKQIWLTQIDDRLYDPLPIFKLALLPLFGAQGRPSPELVEAVWAGVLVSGILALVGLLTRLSLFAFAATTTFLIGHAYSYGEAHHPEAIMTITLWALAFAPSGKALSLDVALLRWWKRKLPGTATDPAGVQRDAFACWPMRLVQWFLAITYLDAGLAKLENAGLTWLNGYTLAFFFGADGMNFGRPLGVFLSGYPGLQIVPSVLALGFELCFIVVLVTRWSWILLPIGLALHGLIYIVQGPPFLEHLALYACFIERLRTGRSNFQTIVRRFTGRA